MSTQSIYAEKTVSVTELRKSPCDYFLDEPVAVLSNNKTAGYMISASLYEQMLNSIAHTKKHSSFRPTKARLESVAETSAAYLAEANDSDLNSFSE